MMMADSMPKATPSKAEKMNCIPGRGIKLSSAGDTGHLTPQLLMHLSG
jgi:hypothetical protein